MTNGQIKVLFQEHSLKASQIAESHPQDKWIDRYASISKQADVNKEQTAHSGTRGHADNGLKMHAC